MTCENTPQIDRALSGGFRLVQFDSEPAVVVDSGGSTWTADQLRHQAAEHVKAARALEVASSYATGHATGLARGWEAAQIAAENSDELDDPSLPGVVPAGLSDEQHEGWVDGYLEGARRFEGNEPHPG